MTLRNKLLGSAVALASVLLGASLAQTQTYDSRYGNGPQSSTPSEMQQTDQLNQQGINGTDQSPSDLNGQQSAQNAPVNDEPPGTQGPYQPRQSQYTQAPNGYPQGGMTNEAPYSGQQPYYSRETQYSPQSQYESQQGQYQDQMQNYRAQQQRYRSERENYVQNLHAYDRAMYDWSYPAPLAYHYGEGYGLRPLYLIAEPSQQLAQAPVEGPGGRWVGRVRNVDIGPDGHPFRVEVALNRRVSVWVSPGDLRFDPAGGVLYTDLTRDELWSMPGATIES